MHKLPETGLLRLPQIIGDPAADPPIPPIIPVSRSTWLGMVRDGLAPKPVTIGARCKAWRTADILKMIEEAA